MELRKSSSEKIVESKKTVVIVGAASSIGDALVPRLMERCSSIVLTECSENYSRLVEKYRNYGVEKCIYFYELNVLNKKQIDNLELFIEEKELEVGSLIYLAGIIHWFRPWK